MALLSVLSAQAAVLPQPDQLCGPFAAHVALHALLDSPPSIPALALAAGTSVWPHDVPAWRPAGAPFVQDGWESLPIASSPSASGTDAAGLAAAVTTLTDLVVIAVAGGGPASAWRALLTGLAPFEVALVANLLTDLGSEPVGHFVAVASYDGETVLLADSYAELTGPGEAPGCHRMSIGELAIAMAMPPGRGLLLMVRPDDADAVRRLVQRAGLTERIWTT